MVERKTLKDPGRKEKADGLYFRPEPSLEFFSTGCAVLDEVLGGGLPITRVVNIVGDKSTGKTLLAIEAAANFRRAYKDGAIRYREAEAAFDRPYAFHLGMPKDVRFNPDDDEEQTVEAMANEMIDFAAETKKKKVPGLYIVDSIDALTDDAEVERKFGQATYGGDKPKALSEFFRREIRKLQASRVCFMMISQVRDNIGALFGEKHKRSGGRALDFYASQVLWLHFKGEIPKTVNGVKRAIGVRIIAKCKKNKVGVPFRSCELPIVFGFGIDDMRANLEWLEEVKRLDAVGLNPNSLTELLKTRKSLSDHEYEDLRVRIARAVHEVWPEIEEDFAPTRRKYL